MVDTTPPPFVSSNGKTRRDFLLYAVSAVGVVGVGLALWPFVDSMNPTADVLALASTDVDLAPLAEGQAITVMWRGKPVFVRHRTAEDIAAAQAVDLSTLRDPQADTERVQRPTWLVMVGICTHLGCVPLGQAPTDPKGDFGGWFCPCHGSQYDTSGRVRTGPAPLNLPIPPYEFTSETSIRIG